MKMSHYSMKTIFIFAFLILFSTETLAQEPLEKVPRPSIRVTGEATLTAKPDQAQIDIGVVTQAQTAQAAATQNAQQLDMVISELRKTIGPEADIKTVSYLVSPNYRYFREGAPPTITGYTATNVVQVKINDLRQVGKVIDVAMQSGANAIQRLHFTLQDEQAVRAQALREAVVKARAKAEVIASALGLKIVNVLFAGEAEPAVVQPLMAERMVAGVEAVAAPTPIEPGTIDVRATIALIVEIKE